MKYPKIGSFNHILSTICYAIVHQSVEMYHSEQQILMLIYYQFHGFDTTLVVSKSQWYFTTNLIDLALLQCAANFDADVLCTTNFMDLILPFQTVNHTGTQLQISLISHYPRLQQISMPIYYQFHGFDTTLVGSKSYW